MTAPTRMGHGSLCPCAECDIHQWHPITDTEAMQNYGDHADDSVVDRLREDGQWFRLHLPPLPELPK